jgi:hypothetical protein
VSLDVFRAPLHLSFLHLLSLFLPPNLIQKKQHLKNRSVWQKPNFKKTMLISVRLVSILFVS